MEPYPRTTTWPYVLLVLALFLVAVVSPRWWRSLDDRQRQVVKAKLTFQPEPPEPELALAPSRVVRPGRVRVDFNPDWLRPQIARMNPQVAQRVIIEPVGGDEANSAVPSEPRVAEPGIDLPLAGGPKNDGTKSSERPVDEALESPGPVNSDQRNSELPISAPVEISDFELRDVSSSLPSRGQLPVLVDARKPSEWPEPTSLLRSLDEVCVDAPIVEAWRGTAVDLLWKIQTESELGSPEVPGILKELIDLTDVLAHVENPASESDRVLLRQIAYGIERRVAVWKAVHELAKSPPTVAKVNVSNALPVIGEIGDVLAESEAAESWRTYLKLDKLNEIATATWVTDPSIRRDTARLVLNRMANQRLTQRQQEFLSRAPFARLADQLRLWAQGPLDLAEITRTIEQFEATRSARLGERVMESMEDLRWADSPETTRMRTVLDTHYRNANVRIAITGQLVNDLLPVLEPIEESVNDNILGASVRGRNSTWTRLRVRLIEDDRRIRLRFMALGNTRSRTLSKKGPVRFFARGQARFSAGKELMVSRRGVSTDQATAIADGNTRITDLETDFDEIPLIGWMMRQLAIEELQDNRAQMRSAVQKRVSSAARDRLDETLQKRLANAELRLKEQVIDPLQKLNLDPSAIEMRTTDERILMRCRIASREQLAAYTPRPRALRDSVMSMQFHESSANNLLEQLDLDGQRIELEDLMRRMSERLDIDRSDIHEDIPEGVKLRLGEDRPIQLDFKDNRVEITIRLAELSTPRRRWRNFVVRGRYRADASAMHVDLERDGGIELISEQLGFRDQIALRGIFTKVMTRNHRLNIIRGRLVDDARLKNLSVRQFVVRDGWIGISVGPNESDQGDAEVNVAAR